MPREHHIYFRGLDLNSLLERYRSGEISKITTPLPVIWEKVDQKPSVLLDSTKEKITYEVDLGIGRSFAFIGMKVYHKGGHQPLDCKEAYNCMYCLRKIDGNPIGIPLRRREIDGKIYYHMIDVFCSFDCCYAELKLRLDNQSYNQSVEYLSEICHQLTGKMLKPAKDWRLLKIFNGDLTWEEFHQGSVRYTHKTGHMCFLPTGEYIEQD